MFGGAQSSELQETIRLRFRENRDVSDKQLAQHYLLTGVTELKSLHALVGTVGPADKSLITSPEADKSTEGGQATAPGQLGEGWPWDEDER